MNEGGARTVLWWGRHDPEYSRNRVMRGLFDSLGWRQIVFRPRAGWTARIEAAFRPPTRPDVVWLPCFRQREYASGLAWARRIGARVVADPLISKYDKRVFEQERFAPSSRAGERLREWEGGLFRAADVLIADTAAHRSFFCEAFGVDPERVRVVHVGAEESLFRPAPMREGDSTEALFYGSFLRLHGAEVVVEAARLTQDERGLTWVLMGDGPQRAECERLAQGLQNVRFEPWAPYATLPERIARAGFVLGVFGDTMKAGRVIPNKVFQACACGRAVVTRESEAYPGASDGLRFVPPADATALAREALRLARDRDARVRAGAAAREYFTTRFSEKRLRDELAAALDRALLSASAR